MEVEDRLKKFFEDQDNLNAVHWLTKGLTYKDIGKKIRKTDSFIQRADNFLKNNGLITGGKWRIDVEAMYMTKKCKFYEYSQNRPKEVLENDEFLTYFADINGEKQGHFVLYTFPNEIKDKIGNSVSPYYYLVPKFKAPLQSSKISQTEFDKAYETENNDSLLPPRGEAIDPDIIHIEIARYVELFGIPDDNESNEDVHKLHDKKPSINFLKLVKIIRDDIQEELGGSADVSYDIVRNRYNDMLKKNIIYSGFGLDMRKLGYVLSFCQINHKEIHRVIKTFSHFDIVCALAYTSESNRYILHLQYRKGDEAKISDILNSLDPKIETYKILKVHNNRVLPYPYYFERERKKQPTGGDTLVLMSR